MAGKIEERILTPEEKLTALADTLFPPPRKAETGPVAGYDVVHDVDDNLDAALYDLRRTGADQVCIHTIEQVAHRLGLARKILGR